MNTMPASSRRSRTLVPLAGLLLLAVVLSPASLAFAAEDGTTATPIPGQLSYSLDSAEPTVSTAKVPWLTQEQLYFNADNSVYWNSYFRGGQGQIQFRGVEYIDYNYNNETDRTDVGSIQETHHVLYLSGSPVPFVRLFAGAGLNTLGLDKSTDGRDSPVFFNGLTFDIGAELGGPIPGLEEYLTLEVGGRYREYNSSRGPEGSRDNMYGQWWRAWVHLAFEPIGERAGFAWVIFAGVGYQYVRERWTLSGTVEEITPNNSAAQSNGPQRLDIAFGTRFIFSESVSVDIEVRIVGPFLLAAGLSFLV